MCEAGWQLLSEDNHKMCFGRLEGSKTANSKLTYKRSRRDRHPDEYSKGYWAAAGYNNSW